MGQVRRWDCLHFNTIGYFLANSTKGWGAIDQLTDGLAAGKDVDTALRDAYRGLSTGQYSVASGPYVPTLYSQYLGHY